MRLAAFALFLIVGPASAANLGDADRILSQIKAVSKEGEGNQQAAAAWRQLVSLGGDVLLPTLAAMDDASAPAFNWLRSAVNAITETEKSAGHKLPADKLEGFVADLKHNPAARRLAYEVLCECDPKTSDRLLPGMLNDPSVELRQDAIAAAVKKAEKLDGDAARNEYARLIAAVRDEDQAKTIAAALEKLGGKPDLIGQFGIVTRWMIAGPFDGPSASRFSSVNEPEKGVDLKATYKGKSGANITWKAFTVEIDTKKFDLDEVGEVDLNKAIGKFKDAVGYAYAVVESDKERPVEIRYGCINASKLFVNGKLAHAHEEYHHGEPFDQYTAKVTLRAGKNDILVKACQNDQKDAWAQVWHFKLRICDATGGAAKVKNVTPEK